MSNNFFVILSKFQLSIQKGAIIMENIDKKYAETCIFLFLELKSPNFIRTKDRHRITYVLVS